MTSNLPAQVLHNTPTKNKMPLLRRIILITMVSAYSISALLGIIAVLAIEVEWRVIATTAIVGTASLVVLCGQTVLSIDKWKWLGIITSIIGLIAATLGILLLWEIISSGYSDDSMGSTSAQVFYHAALNILALSSFYAGAGVFSTLLIAASYGLGRFPVITSYVTLALNILASFLVTTLVLGGSGSDYDGLSKFLAVVIILSSLSLLIALTVSLIQKVTQKTNKVTIVKTNDDENISYTNTPASSLNPYVSKAPQPAYPITEESIEMLRSHAAWQGMDINTYVYNLVTRDAKEYNEKSPTVP